jgi:signal recognition particle subunit SRP54
MFDNLSQRLGKTLGSLTGRRLTEDNIKSMQREIRLALLEADVALPAVQSFLDQVQSEAVGQKVLKSLKPGEALVKIVKDKLISLMGDTQAELDLQAKPPVVILLAGLQGAGKTTTVAKLGYWLREVQKKSVMVTSADVYRPAAIEQLASLAEQTSLEFHQSDASQKPVDIAKSAIAVAKTKQCDVLIVDTAGRLHVDQDMMDEIQQLHKAISPTETLFVVDSMTGQDAANTAKAFGDALPLTGVILTKTDGDARGGAALSVRMITGKPIKFMGVGEKFDQIEPFHPDRVASRILGMGDVLSLVEEAQRKIDDKVAKKVTKKIRKGGFDLEDFRTQLQQMKKMGGIGGMMSKMPGLGGLPGGAASQLNDKTFLHMEAMISSMTMKERVNPDLLKRGSRKRRIAAGSGRTIEDLNKLLKQFKQMSRMMKKFKGGNMSKMMEKMQGMLPPM